MGKLFDYCMTGNWEETQRISLFKKIGKLIEKNDLSKEQLEEINKIIKKNKSGG